MFARLAARLSRVSARSPWAILAAALVASVPAAFQAGRIKLDTDLKRILPRSSPAVVWSRRLEDVVGDAGNFTLLFEGRDPAALERALDEAVGRARALPGVQSVEDRHPVDFLRRYRYLLVPSEHLERILERVEAIERRVNPTVVDLGLDDDEEPAGAAAAGAAARNGTADEEVEREIRRYLDLPERFWSDDRTMIGAIVRPRRGITSLGKTRRLFGELDAIVQDVARRDGLWGAVAGSNRNKVDSYDQIVADLNRSGLVAGIGIVLVLLVSFRSLQILPVVLLPVGLGLLWAYALIPWTVGDLNMLTSFLLMVLFGTGVEFAVHLVKRFQEELTVTGVEAALAETFGSTGRSILTSGLSTTLGLAILVLSRLRGFSEFGLISGGSILAIFAAMFLVLPAALAAGARIGLVRPHRAEARAWSFVAPPVVAAGVLVAVAVAGVLAAVWLASGRGFDYDFTRLGHEIPAAEEIRARNRKVFPGYSVPGVLYVARDLDAVDRLTRALEAARARAGATSRIGKVTSVRDWLPDAEELARRRRLVAELQERVRARWVQRIEEPDERRWVADLAAFEPPAELPGPAELPEEIRRPLAARDDSGQWVVGVGVKGKSRDGAVAMAFTRELYALELPEGVRGPTGEKAVLAEILWLVTAEGQWLVLGTLAGVFGLVWLDRRRLGETLWILLPLVGGLLLTFGGMMALGWKLNFFNLVVLPSLLGNAVDNGVHYFRRWRETGDVWAVQRELGSPVTTSVLTTAIGYAGMTFAHHAGLRSIGWLAVLGLGATWFTGVVWMPSVLAWLGRRERRTPRPA